ncbi:hypothetical protein HPB52_005584 [Rhipicephalus sanguineus]|uniref:Glycoside hydrolase 35 catalytic domain-containing protein n=1 Tax=Rhipicephalus sanguineus TaxID=34632 RepID=A0A9D4T2X4_RHISA|nr:hypothetical protein HPB52_005584 [Rhipicephalus sanguineus]
MKARRSFVIDYENDRFLKDGEPIQVVAGAIHYFRTLPQLWDNRLTTIKTAGLNAIQTYVEWSSHEPEEGQFAGAQELVHFLNLGPESRLTGSLRIGPYICAERDLIENEYGSYKACDFSYMAWLRDLVRHHLGRDVILYTTDGAGDGFLQCGKVDGAYTNR